MVLFLKVLMSIVKHLIGKLMKVLIVYWMSRRRVYENLGEQ